MRSTTLNKVKKVEPYQARISQEVLEQSLDRVVRVWSDPKSAVEGAKVVDKIGEPISVTVVEEQEGMHGSMAQRVKVQYGEDKESWILAHMINL